MQLGYYAEVMAGLASFSYPLVGVWLFRDLPLCFFGVGWALLGCTLCYAIVLPGRKSAFRAGFWPDCYREGTEIGPPTGLRPAGGLISVPSR